MGDADSSARERTLLELALNDPATAVDEATAILMLDRRDRSHVVALRARGAARRRLGEFAQSENDLSAALEQAEGVGGPNLWAEVALTLSGTLVHLGRVDEAKELLDRCIDCATGRALAESRYQLGTTHAQAGDLDAAVAEYERALPLIRQAGETDWEGGLLGNRGTMNIYRGDYDAAVADLTAGLDLLRRTASGPAQIALFMNNLAYALHLRGDVSESLDLYRESEELQRAHDLPTAMYAHKANAYLSVGMYEETLALAQEAHRFHRSGAAVVGAIEALLAGADAALELERHALAAELAKTALTLDADDSFPVWRARAQLVDLDVAVRAAAVAPDHQERIEQVRAAALGGDAVVAARALLVGARAALQNLDLDRADELLRRSVDDDDPSGSVAIERFRLGAELAAARAEPIEVRDTVEAGLARFEQLVAASPSYDTSHKVARHVDRLTDLGVRAALERGDADGAIAMIERVRSTGLAAHRSDEPSFAMLTWVDVSGELIRLEQSGDVRTISCGPTREIAELCEAQGFAVRQLARRVSLSDRVVSELVDQVSSASADLAARLLPEQPGDRVVLNPPSALSGVSWGLLASLRSVEHVVAPSAWLGSRPVGGSVTSVAAIASSELPHAMAEVEAIASLWSVAPAIDPADPRRIADGTDVLHVAGHFLNDTENPLLSRIPLGASALRGADLSALSASPRMLVLSACSSGSMAAMGPAQVGFASAALAAGTRCVVTTSAPVEDSMRLADLMYEFHHQLREGSAPAAALRLLRADADDLTAQLASTIGIYGTGW